MITCERCGALYRYEKSTAELRMTYCTAMCQSRDGLLTVRDLLLSERVPDGATKARIYRKMKAHMEREDARLLQEAAG